MGNLINLPNITPESIVVNNDNSNNYTKHNEFNEKDSHDSPSPYGP